MNALIALAVWCQSHGPVTILTTHHRRSASTVCLSTSTSSTSTSIVTAASVNSSSSATSSGHQPRPSQSKPDANTHPRPRTDDANITASTATTTTTTTATTFSSSASNSTSTLSSTSANNESASDSHSTLSSPTAVPVTTAACSPSSGPPIEPKKSRRSIHQQQLPGGSGGGSGSNNSVVNGSSGGGSGHSPIGGRPLSMVGTSSNGMGGSGGGGGGGGSNSTSSASCECQFSIPSGERSLHSVDPANSELSYISQPVPVDQSLFAPIRIACIRSLNSETYSGREGSVFFGDGVNGYVLSYMFTVYDAQSRGHRIKYTVMTMMTDRVYLVANMDYLISQFQVIASNLQAMANAVTPQLQHQQSPATRSLSYSSSHHRGSIPENAPTKRGRPLTDVLSKPDIFVQLHAAFVSVLSNCSRRLSERHIQGRPTNEPFLSYSNFNTPRTTKLRNEFGEEPFETVDSLRELRRVLGRQKFNRLLWNSLVGNQVIIRGEESRIVKEIIKALEDVLPQDCCTVIADGMTYEPSYACNILGLDRSVPIPPDMDPMDFILLDVCLTTFSHQIPTPPTSLPAENQLKNGLTDPKAALSYRADWSAVDGVSGLTNRMDKTELYDSTQQTKKVNGELSDKDKTALAESPGRGKTGSRPPTSMPGLQYSSGSGFQAQRRIYLLQAGEEPPEVLQWNPGEMNGKKMSPGLATGAGLQQVQCPLYVEIVNEILDLKMPRAIEAKRLELLREDWISKSRQFHNMYLACFASDEGKVENFLLSMNVDRRDLKILRFFTRCARSAALQSQKYRSENPLVAMTAAAEAAEAAMAAAAAAAAEARVENQMHGPVLAQGPVQAGTPTVAAVTTAATVVTVSGTSATGYQKKSNGG